MDFLALSITLYVLGAVSAYAAMRAIMQLNPDQDSAAPLNVQRFRCAVLATLWPGMAPMFAIFEIFPPVRRWVTGDQR